MSDPFFCRSTEIDPCVPRPYSATHAGSIAACVAEYGRGTLRSILRALLAPRPAGVGRRERRTGVNSYLHLRGTEAGRPGTAPRPPEAFRALAAEAPQ